MIPGSVTPLLLRSAAPTESQISRSVRFNSSDSAYCGRAFSTNGTDRKKLSFSFWVKLCDTSAVRTVISGYNGSSAQAAYWQFNSGGAFSLSLGGASSYGITTTQVFRDPSAWYHFLVSIDTTIASPSSDRIKLYVNGTQITTFSSATYPTQNYEVNLLNSGTQTNIGVAWNTGYGGYMNGYLADVHFIDGQALTPADFTETSATTGQLIPKAYTGTFGTNGFWLKFSDNSAATATTLGKDYSSNGNNWTPNNLSVTAGAGNDSLVDTPTSYGTDTGAGGEVRGNYCTLNPLDDINGATITNGNLDISMGVGARAQGTIATSSGKWYWEVTVNSSGNLNFAGGVYNQTTKNGYGYYGFDGRYYFPGGDSAYGSSYAAGDIIGVALDLDSGKIFFSKNGTWQNSGNPATGTNPANSTTLPAGFYAPRIVHGAGTGSSSNSANFGQRPFAYTAPSGFKALCDTNLPAPVVAQPSTVMDALIYTGNDDGSNTISQTITGLAFSPDLVWIKRRPNPDNHAIFDIVRGAGKKLRSNTTDAELSLSYDTGQAFNSNGFTTGAADDTNKSNTSYIAWTWDAGTTTASNPDGSITSSVRANASAGFSVVTMTTAGTGTYTWGHGLNVAPAMVIVKDRDNAGTSWFVYHSAVVTNTSQYLNLNTTGALATAAGIWGSALPTSTVVSMTANTGVFANAKAVAYCFAPVAGYSSFGSYTGNGSADGPFVYTGFRPRWVLVKASSSVSFGSWRLHDTARDPYNVCGNQLIPNLSDAEYGPGATGPVMDILSNGFKLRQNFDGWNGSGATYIYCAFAESPLQYSRAR